MSIAPGVYQEVVIKDPLAETLSVEDFLRLLDPEVEKRVLAELERSYKDIRKCDYPILPQFRALVYMKLCKIKYLTVLHRKLKAEDGRLAEKLGFERGEDGKIRLPSYKNFWVLLKKRLSEEKIDTISESILIGLKNALSTNGVELGKSVGHDGYVIRAHDKEAKYNTHYETKMYKGEIGFDLDLMVPLYSSAEEGTAYDGDYLIPFAERLEKIEKKSRKLYADGHYPTLVNFAILNHVYKWRTVMNIPQNQRIISEVGSLESIDKWYQSFHDKDDFVVDADLEQKLSLILRYGRVEEVGYHYRNRYVQEILDNKEAYESEYHNRSLEETGNNLMKNGLVDTENASNGTGLRNRNLHVKLCTLAMQIVALIRAKYGRTARLTTVENLAC